MEQNLETYLNENEQLMKMKTQIKDDVWEMKMEDFQKQCLYCNGTCIVDNEHPDQNKFEEVRTKDTTIYKQTLNICKIKTDNLAKRIEFR